MADYATTEMDAVKRIMPKVLLCGPAPAGLDAAAFRIERAGTDPVSALLDALADIVVLDAALATAAVADALAGPRLAGVPIILLTRDADSDAAGLLLGLNLVAFLPADASAAQLQQALSSVVVSSGVADMNAGFDPDSRFAALRRDAERMAAALAELSLERGPTAAA